MESSKLKKKDKRSKKLVDPKKFGLKRKILWKYKKYNKIEKTEIVSDYII